MESLRCQQCEEPNAVDSEYCIYCGTILNKSQLILCAFHPDRLAQCVCVLCQQPLCETCSIHVDKRVLCTFHQDVELVEDFAIIYTSSDVTEADLIRAVLEENGFQVVVQNFDSIAYMWDGGGDSSVSRSNLSKPARVLVPLWEYADAEQCIEEWRSGQQVQE
ncbi:MAG: DUF2007 domain-containing protein [Bacteroidetes bacterium]|nr:DUF2007 domain-containing protein [Bacteroidota bacterium]